MEIPPEWQRLFQAIDAVCERESQRKFLVSEAAMVLRHTSQQQPKPVQQPVSLGRAGDKKDKPS